MNEKDILIQAISAVPEQGGAELPQPLSCEISAAKLVCILGQQIDTLNACMEMLAGIKEPYSGSVNHADNLSDSKLDYSAIGFIAHDSTLLSVLNGVNNVVAPALYHQIAAENEIQEDADILLAEFEYEADHTLLPAFMHTLQKRHLLVVRAIMLKPRVLFIQNPFMGLDREQVRIFGKYLARLVKDKNITVITSNVNLDFVQNYADQVIYSSSAAIQFFKQRDDFFNHIQKTTD